MYIFLSSLWFNVVLSPHPTEGDGSGDSCCESSGEDEVVHKPKPLQARRSILDLDSKQTEEPPAKRAKREDTVVSLASRLFEGKFLSHPKPNSGVFKDSHPLPSSVFNL